MKGLKRTGITLLGAGLILGCAFSMTGCGIGGDKRIIRISHAQSETHPEHLGLLVFKDYIEENLGDKYEVQIYPNELLGGAQKAIELTQTGAIDFVVAGTANLENFADVYEVFSMPYLFTSEEAYHEAMNDTEFMEQVYESTDEAGFRVLTWYNAGTRSFYAKTPIYTPDDLKGLKMRVQQSQASVNMCNSFGAAASPMSFGEVYTAIQQGVIDGAENNELALTNNKHGEVAKYYSYNRHQMVPDMLIGNLKFLEGLSDEEYEIFHEAALLSTEEEMKYWDEQVEEAKRIATEDMGVTFIDVDVELFKEKVADVQQEMLDANESIRDLYDHIQEVNAKYAQSADDTSDAAAADDTEAETVSDDTEAAEPETNGADPATTESAPDENQPDEPAESETQEEA